MLCYKTNGKRHSVASCDSYASFVLSNLPHASKLNSTRCGVYHLLSGQLESILVAVGSVYNSAEGLGSIGSWDAC